MVSSLPLRLPALLWLMGLALIASAASLAHAHRGSTKYLRIEHADDGALVRVALERVDVAVELGLPESTTLEALLREAPRIHAWMRRTLSVRAGATPCEPSFARPEPDEREGLEYVALDVRFRCSEGALTLRDDAIFDDDPQHEAIVSTLFAGEGDATILRAASREFALGAPPSLGTIARRFLWEGALHLVTGYDHLLFLVSLLLTAAELAARRGLRAGLVDVSWIVTAFTLGHSVTLVAAALGVVVLPSRFVESTIAASIVVAAILNLAMPDVRKGLPWITFAFGLIHGFGFSGVLAELGLPARARVGSLIAFNLGIELAQLVFVALLIGPLAWLASRRDFYRRYVVFGGSGLVACIAMYWFVERAFAV